MSAIAFVLSFTIFTVTKTHAPFSKSSSASDHKEAFDLAHQSFLNKTVHAGEAYGPESIFSAITDLHAERIGHGCNLFKWDIIGEGEGRGGRSKTNKEKEEMSDDQKRAYVENLTRYLGVSIILDLAVVFISPCAYCSPLGLLWVYRTDYENMHGSLSVIKFTNHARTWGQSVQSSCTQND